jgi:translocation and assembly module TamB
VPISLAIAAFVFWCLYTTAGTRWLINSAGNFSELNITITELEGSLLDNLAVKELRVTWEDGEVSAGNIKLSIRQLRPFSRLLAIEELSISRLVLRLDEDSEDTTADSDEDPGSDALLAAFPGWLKITIDQLEISGFVYRNTAEPDDDVVIADLIAGQYLLVDQRLVSRDFSYHSPYVELDGEFEWELARPHLEMTASVYLPETCVESALLDSILVPIRFPGHIELVGDWNNFNGPVQLGIKDQAGDAVWLTATAIGSWRGIRFDNLEGRYLGGAISGELDMAWIDAYRLEGQLSGQGLNPSALIDGAAGSTSFDASGELYVPYDDEPLQAGLDAMIHEARLKGHALQGKAAGQWLGQELVGLHLDLAGDAARLWAKGIPAQRVDIDLEVSDLTMYQQGVSGQVAAGGWLSWSEDSFAGEIDGYGEDLAWQDVKVQRIELQGRHRAGEQSVVLSLSGDGWSHGNLHLQQLAGVLSGTLVDHRFELAADSSSGQFTMSGTGSYHPGIWTGRFEELIGVGTPWGSWAMPEPTTMLWDDGVITVDRLPLVADAGARLQFELDNWGSPHRAGATLSWAGFKLEWLQPFAAFDNLAGQVDGHVEYTMHDGQPWSMSGRATAHGQITDEDLEWAYKDLELNFDWGQTGLLLTGKAGIDHGESIQVEATASGPPRWQWPIAGLVTELQWQGLKLSRFNRFLRDTQAEGTSEGSLFFALDDDRLETVKGQASAIGRLLHEERELGPRSLLLDLSWVNRDFQCKAKIAGTKGSRAEINLTAIQRPTLAWPDSGQIELMIDDLSLAAIEPLLPRDIDFSGVIDGQAEGLWGQAGVIEVGGFLNLQQSLVSWDSDSGQVFLPLQNARAEWNWSGDNLSGTFDLDLTDHGDINGSWRLPLPARFPTAFEPHGQLQLMVNGKMQATGILSAIGPWLMQDVRGETRMQLAVQGTWEKPDLRGSLLFKDGSAYLPEAGIQLEEIQLQSELAGDRLQINRLSLRSGSGELSGRGEILFDRWRLAGYRMDITGENFQAANFPELQMALSPDLALTGTADRLALQGSVLVPLLAITGSRDTPEVLPNKDVVVITTVEQRQELAFATDIRVDVKLGEEVTMKTGGVDTRLAGGGTVTMGPTGELLARGEIQLVSGSFRAYGVNLAIRQGVLSYQGGILTNPDLKIFAAREVGEVLAGVQVTGNAEAPVVSLYSRPAMPDRDILGYMLMGRAIRTESEESDMLMMGAGSLLGNYGGGLSELGITEIDIQGLFSGTGGLRLRRKIAEKWEVQSTLGIESGVDLFYIIELE